jgi:hypothetical protein
LRTLTWLEESRWFWSKSGTFKVLLFRIRDYCLGYSWMENDSIANWNLGIDSGWDLESLLRMSPLFFSLNAASVITGW